MVGAPLKSRGAVLLAALVLAISLVGVGTVMYFVVLVLVGPHTGALSARWEPTVLALAWGLVVGLPLWAAQRVHRVLMRRGRRADRNDPARREGGG